MDFRDTKQVYIYIYVLFFYKCWMKDKEFWECTIWYTCYLDVEFSVGAVKN